MYISGFGAGGRGKIARKRERCEAGDVLSNYLSFCSFSFSPSRKYNCARGTGMDDVWVDRWTSAKGQDSCKTFVPSSRFLSFVVFD